MFPTPCLAGSAPQVYSSSVTPGVKRQCLTTLAKMLHFNTADTLAGEAVGAPVCGCGGADVGSLWADTSSDGSPDFA